MFRHSTADFADGGVNMLPVNVRITQHHSHRLMTADFLDRWKVNTGLYEVGYRRVAHDVRGNLQGIEASTKYGAAKWFAHPVPVAFLGCIWTR